MNFKKLIFIILTVFCIMNNLKVHALDEYDDIDIGSVDLDALEYETRFCPIEVDKDIIKQMVGLIGPDITTPLWEHTKPPRGRDILYLLPQKLLAIEYGGVVANLYFNYTPKMNFSTDETLKLDENQKALDTIIALLNSFLQSEETSSLVPLFKKLTIQERRMGALIQAGFFVGPLTFQLNTSLQMSERNFWLNENDQERITAMFDGFEGSFDEKELYKIKYGLGDTRLKLGLNTLNMSNAQVDIGLEGIFPTSKISSIPRLNEYDINLDDFEATIHNVLRSTRDHLITPRLGNGGHLGLGIYLETKFDLFHDRIHWWNRVSFDNLFTAEESRLIPSKVTIPSPSANPAYFKETIVDPMNRTENPDYGPATEFIKQYLFPPPYRVNVKPGGIFTFVSSLTFDLGRKWSLGLGYDYYMQQKETFEDLYDKKIDRNSLEIKDAESDRSNQHKLFAEINYMKKQKNGDLNIGFGGDYTVSSEGIGRDWTIFVRLGFSF